MLNAAKSRNALSNSRNSLPLPRELKREDDIMALEGRSDSSLAVEFVTRRKLLRQPLYVRCLQESVRLFSGEDSVEIESVKF